MSILSLTAVGRLAQRRCREIAQPVPRDELVAWLEAHGVDTDRAHAGIRLALIVGRLTATSDTAGRRCVQYPTEAAA